MAMRGNQSVTTDETSTLVSSAKAAPATPHIKAKTNSALVSISYSL